MRNADGSITIVFADGSKKLPDGSYVDANGKPLTIPAPLSPLPPGAVLLPDGSVRLSDGSLRLPSGAILLPGGQGVRLANGKVVAAIELPGTAGGPAGGSASSSGGSSGAAPLFCVCC